jgi:cytochrome oxidase Cu insertion factor (SCO1/SenC/PrrC family)
VSQAVVGGFKVSAAKVDRGANEHDVVHGNWFVLVDPQGRLRGYYATDDPGFENTVVNDVGRLERPR